MEKELIKLTGIYKSFAGVQALQNVDFTIREGEVRCLAGENLSGLCRFPQPHGGREYRHYIRI